MADIPKTIGVLLAGGLARRMGGGDKPLLKIGGSTILDLAIAALRPQCEALILNANGDPARFAATGLTVIADDVPGFAGPLAGILAALDWTAKSRPDVGWVVSVAADSPFLPKDFVARLHEAREAAGTPLAQAQAGEQTYPVNGLWKVSLRGDLRHALVEEDMRKIDRWTARHGVVSVIWPDKPVDPFFNANTPEELVEAEKLIASRS
ncbi:molybdenum cofactor guanylyltransferase [Terrihabitans soli]|uniref:Molybdenum cofactor guanylyltransferase n=1 Tax=Terrihabitans soli TaxID=708113 RepID=A0A6S6QX01_9HYPH|nr:molybdenum cofactor guanylyltransferase MobA [Terrihabitans soli]BCJ92095.1 molybdenum cofactor guanylyltransferase [Terrihabitans soli]